MKYLAHHIRTQAQAEAPRLLLATLSLLIVGLMLSPRETQQRSEVALDESVEISKDLKLAATSKKFEKMSVSRR